MSTLQPLEKPLKIVCVAISEMGHFIPMSNVADILIKRGHDVYFVTQTLKYNGDRPQKIMESVGCTGDHQIFTDDEMTREEMMKAPESLTDNHQTKWSKKWQIMVDEKIEKLQPDLVICDWYTQTGALAADKLKIPCIINTPGMLDMYHHWGMSGTYNPKNSSVCCGMICFKQPLFNWFIRKLSFHVSQTDANYIYSHSGRTVMFNSFWGLDKAVPIPPNYHMVGPISKPQGDLLPIFEEKDPDLFKWLNDAQAENQKVVYVSIGTVCKWQEWSVKEMYEGLKKLGCKVVWSLKEFKIPEDNPNFWVKEWVPQIEVLAHPAVKAGLCHCGFGGCLEFISAAKPIVALPHFGDQPQNAVMMEKQGLGVILYNRGDELDTEMKNIIYKDQVFTAQQVHDTFKEVLENQVYTNNIQKQQQLAKTMGGRDEVAKICENTALVGDAHLIDQIAKAQHAQISWCTCCCFVMFVLLLFAGLLTCTIIYILDQVGE